MNATITMDELRGLTVTNVLYALSSAAMMERVLRDDPDIVAIVNYLHENWDAAVSFSFEARRAAVRVESPHYRHPDEMPLVVALYVLGESWIVLRNNLAASIIATNAPNVLGWGYRFAQQRRDVPTDKLVRPAPTARERLTSGESSDGEAVLRVGL